MKGHSMGAISPQSYEVEKDYASADPDDPVAFCCCGAHHADDLTFPPPDRLFTPWDRKPIMLPNDRPVLLRHLRLFQHASQGQVAERIGVQQPTVSKWDNASDMKVSTLRTYIEALGGRLELHAVLKHETIRVTFPKPRPRRRRPDLRPLRNWPD